MMGNKRPEFGIEDPLAGEKMPTAYDQFGDPKTQSREIRINTAVGVFKIYRRREQELSHEELERAQIELDQFLRWIDLSDDEYEEADRLASQESDWKPLSPQEGYTQPIKEEE